MNEQLSHLPTDGHYWTIRQELSSYMRGHVKNCRWLFTIIEDDLDYAALSEQIKQAVAALVVTLES